jgi:hypothetical protein
MPPRLERGISGGHHYVDNRHVVSKHVGRPCADKADGASRAVHGQDGRKYRLNLKDAAGESDQGGRRGQDKDGSAELGLVDV